MTDKYWEDRLWELIETYLEASSALDEFMREHVR